MTALILLLRLKVISSKRRNAIQTVGITTNVEGENGKIDIIRPESSVEVSLENGNVSITPDPQKHYRYETSVENGTIQSNSKRDFFQIGRVSVRSFLQILSR